MLSVRANRFTKRSLLGSEDSLSQRVKAELHKTLFFFFPQTFSLFGDPENESELIHAAVSQTYAALLRLVLAAVPLLALKHIDFPLPIVTLIILFIN